LIFFVDNDNDIEESDETNNLVSTATTITVGVSDALAVEISATPDCAGMVALESVVAGGELPYTYSWSTGESTADIVVATTADYTVTVIDGAQEQFVAAISVTVPEVLIIDTSINQQPGGGQQGEIEIFISGGVLPYNILWSDGFTGAINNGLVAGTYDVTVTDANGCMRNTQVILEETAGPLPDLTAGNVVGFEGMHAQDEVVEFTWDLINLGQGVAVDNYRIVMYLSEDQLFSSDDVAVGEVPTGNTFPGTISGVPGAITIPSNQFDGEYYLHFFVDNDDVIEETDENNNIFTTSTTITVGVEVVEPLVVDVLSSLDCDGFAMLEAAGQGGIGSYSYTWSTGATTASIIVSTTGSYTVTVTDDSQESVVFDTFVTVPEVLAVTAMINQQPSSGQLGDISISITGGALPYDINWSNGDTGTQNDDLPAGNYVIMVTDANGCMTSVQVLLADAGDFTVNATVTQLTCSDSNDASISLVTNLSATYAWSTGATTSGIMNLAAGTYSVTVTSINNDEVIRSFTVTQINPIELISSVESVTCFGDMNGALNALATGGTGPYTYTWSNGETTNNISNLSGGDFDLTVTDANGCEETFSFTIVEPAMIELGLSVINVTCPNGNDGSITVTQATGGTPPYSYSWSNGAMTTIITNLAAGAYTLTLTDANGCVVTESVVVSAPDAITISDSRRQYFEHRSTA